jgi:rRNA-processing protein EBP2
MPKGRKKALKAAMEEGGGDGVDQEEDLDGMMELEVARQMMLEQEAARRAEQQGEEPDEGGRVSHSFNKAGLEARTGDVLQPDRPWAETLVVDSIDLGLGPDEVQDDLKREMAFYQNSLQSVLNGCARLAQLGIAYRRPDDFMCEMVKDDAHMARIKDKLIFEQKKMEAFQQRKDRQEQKKYSKEVQAEKQKEKAQQKKATLKAVDQWKKESKSRGGLKGALQDDDGLDSVLSGRSKMDAKRKRADKDKKYGHAPGGRLERKRVTSKELDDLSGFNPRGGKFARKGGAGGGKGKAAGKPSRPGKAARASKKGRSR